MEELEQKIRTNYPMLWNTRAYIIIPLVLILNLVYYYFGSTTHSSQYYEYNEVTGTFIVFTFLLAFTILTIWLNYFFRFNALKSGYPLSKNMLFGSFACIFVVALGLCSLGLTYSIAIPRYHHLLDTNEFLMVLYPATAISLLIFSFRVTNTRLWFIALIGAGILMILFGLASSSGFGNFYFLFTLFVAGCLVFALINIGQRRMKREAGIALIWAMWFSMALLPLSVTYYMSTENYAYRSSVDWAFINLLNVVVIFLLVRFLFIPAAFRWQACPEE